MSDEIGPNVRRRRLALELSLEMLAEKSGVSAAMLSEVERGVKNPTVKLAYQIARALGCTLTELIGEEPVPQVTITRKRELRTLVDPASGVRRAGQRSDLLNRHLEIAWYTLPKGQATGEMAPNRPGLVEQILVLSGQLTVVLDGEPHRLAAGDSVTYGVQTTNYVNASENEDCTFLLLSDSSRVS
ncbi:MAG: helix-turn-helix transcriptional regulator [Thermoanaerobaculia bacterium]|nr:helix-turn-helix transcriptional regulator [Thermoanaerobaculia bacterium]